MQMSVPTRLRELGRSGVFAEGYPWAAVTLLIFAAGALMSLGYEPLNHGPYRIFLRTPLDEVMPTVPIFVVPYVSLKAYITGSMLVFVVVRAEVFRSAAVAMIVTWAVSYACYVVMQSYIVRPPVMGQDVFSSMVRTVYASDNPFNDFPSLHVGLSTIIAFHWWRFDRRAGVLASIWTALIVASTQLIHQHYLADVAGGLVLALGTSALAWRFVPRRRTVGGESEPVTAA